MPRRPSRPRRSTAARSPATAPAPIRLRGVRQNNLKGIDVDFPYDQLTVVTGVSGSGKSSLVFDTLYAEGQRRYVESFSAYARQFMERMPRPLADSIDDLPPAVAVEQANPVRTSRSTVGTMSELTDHLKLLFAKLAVLHCPGCDEPVQAQDAAHVADAVEGLPTGAKFLLTFPLPPAGGLPFADQVRGLRAAGLSRWWDPVSESIRDLDPDAPPQGDAAAEIVLDRLVAGRTDRSRILDSAEHALRLGRGTLALRVLGKGYAQRFSSDRHCARCDRSFRPASPNLFSFNSALGACAPCKGFGRTIDFDEDLVVPDPTLPLERGAIRPWTTPRTRVERRELQEFCEEEGIPLDVPWEDLDEDLQRAVIDGDEHYYGVRGWFKWLEGKAYKMRVRVLLSRYRTYRTCLDCGGSRRRPEALRYRLADRTIHEWEQRPVSQIRSLVRSLQLTPGQRQVARVVLEGTESRLTYLDEVGLGYLTLDRATRTLSGGEFQRVNLATALGAALVNTLYVLDEPSVGLHPRDTHRLIEILHRLRDRGNTLVVVEHDPDTLVAADHVIDVGPGAGEQGGEVLFQGPLSALAGAENSVTARFLSGEETVRAEDRASRDPTGEVTLLGCRGNNLRDLDIRIPTGSLTVLCGVSGSGKSSLLTDTLYPAARAALGDRSARPLPHDALEGLEPFARCDLVDQSPIGRTPRSNPASYVGATTPLRKLLASTDDARRLGLTAKSFSSNTRGGRCPVCEGAGAEKLEMQFLADVFVPCPECEGRRFRPDVLEVRFRRKNVHEILGLTVDDALQFFSGEVKFEITLRDKLRGLVDVGLGYLRLGQSATTLSGGEAQRLKLATHLPRGRITRSKRGLFLFDEPTTGLHLADVRTLLTCLHRLVDAGHTVVVVEHHLSVIAAADQVIELGPDGGEAGGRIVAEGTPEEVAATDGSPTAPFLRRELGQG